MSENETIITSVNHLGMVKYSSDVIKKGLILANQLQSGKQNLNTSPKNKSDEFYLKALYDQALIQYKLANFKKAIEIFNQLIDESPKNFDWLFLRGAAYSQIGNDNIAYEDWKKALSVSQYQHRRSVRFLYAQTLLKHLNNEETNFYEVLAASPEHKSFLGAIDLSLQGGVYNIIGNKIMAIEKFNQAINIENNCVSFLFLRGTSYFQACLIDVIAYQGSHIITEYLVKALEDSNKALALNPEHDRNEGTYFIRSHIHYYLKDNSKALKDLARVLEIDPTYVNALNLQGSIYYEEGDYKKAVDSYTKVIWLEPNNTEAYSNRSKARMMIGDIDGASEDLSKSMLLSLSLPQ